MESVVLEEDREVKMEKLLNEAYYTGERAIVIGKKGSKAAIVPLEDLDFLEKVENLLNEACYAGERIILKDKEGGKVAIVPLEDLEILEEID